MVMSISGLVGSGLDVWLVLQQCQVHGISYLSPAAQKRPSALCMASPLVNVDCVARQYTCLWQVVDMVREGLKRGSSAKDVARSVVTCCLNGTAPGGTSGDNITFLLVVLKNRENSKA